MVSGYEGICVSDDARNYQATGFIDREESLSGTYHPLQICTTGGSCMPVLHSLNRSLHMSPTMELKSYYVPPVTCQGNYTLAALVLPQTDKSASHSDDSWIFVDSKR